MKTSLSAESLRKPTLPPSSPQGIYFRAFNGFEQSISSSRFLCLGDIPSQDDAVWSAVTGILVQNATRLQDLCAGGSKELHPSTKPRMTLSVQRKAIITVVTAKKPVNWKLAQKRAARTARWAVIMTKVRMRRVMARTRWQLVTFGGPAGSESTGVVDLLAIRKDHRKPRNGMKRGDGLQIVLIQMKGGGAAMPTAEDAHRLRAVSQRHQVRDVLFASWIKGKPVRIFIFAIAN